MSNKNLEHIQKMRVDAEKGLSQNRFATYKGRMRFGEKIEKLMIAHGHTQSELARRIGTQAASISNVIQGKQRLRPQQLLAISKLYDVSIDSLLDDEREIESWGTKERLIWETVRRIGVDEALNRLLLTREGGTGKESSSNRTGLPTSYDWGEMPKPKPESDKPARKKPG